MSQPNIGSMQLFDAVRPAMQDGLHSITSTIVVETGVAPPPLNQALHRDFVQVGGSGLHVQPTEVVACHPPRNGTGGYATELPHVVLSRRTLPWERSGPQGAPWMALLIFADSEVHFTSMSLQATVGAAAAAAFEAEESGSSGATVDAVIVLNPGVLHAVLPTPVELGLLSHIRRVNTADTTLDMTDDDGWLAVVVANRLPLGGTSPVHYHACLVSLEHRDDLYGQPATTSLLLLYRWDFITDTGGTFAILSKALDTGVLGQPGTNGPDTSGRTTVAHTAREGTQSESTYRGPFTIGATPLTDDPSDVSYDTAYELGRLLGAADGPFTRDLVDWHRAAMNAAHAKQQRATIRALAEQHADAKVELTSQPPHVMAAAAGLAAMLRGLARPAPHRAVRREPAEGETDA
jgi:hypothetical protein